MILSVIAVSTACGYSIIVRRVFPGAPLLHSCEDGAFEVLPGVERSAVDSTLHRRPAVHNLMILSGIVVAISMATVQ